MTGCTTCGGFGDRHDPIAHGAEVETGDRRCPEAFSTPYGDRRCDLDAGHDGYHVRNDGCGRPEYFWGQR